MKKMIIIVLMLCNILVISSCNDGQTGQPRTYFYFDSSAELLHLFYNGYGVVLDEERKNLTSEEYYEKYNSYFRDCFFVINLDEENQYIDKMNYVSRYGDFDTSKEDLIALPNFAVYQAKDNDYGLYFITIEFTDGSQNWYKDNSMNYSEFDINKVHIVHCGNTNKDNSVAYRIIDKPYSKYIDYFVSEKYGRQVVNDKKYTNKEFMPEDNFFFDTFLEKEKTQVVYSMPYCMYYDDLENINQETKYLLDIRFYYDLGVENIDDYSKEHFKLIDNSYYYEYELSEETYAYEQNIINLIYENLELYQFIDSQ